MIRRAKQNLSLTFWTIVDKTDLLVSNIRCRRRCLVGAAGDQPCCHQKSRATAATQEIKCQAHTPSRSEYSAV